MATKAKALELRKVTFQFEDGSTRILTGDELVTWEVICYNKSDYLLPQSAADVLASTAGGLVQGFVLPEQVRPYAR